MGCSNVKPVKGVTLEQWKEKRWSEMSLDLIPNGGGLIVMRERDNTNIVDGKLLVEVEGIPVMFQNLHNLGVFN